METAPAPSPIDRQRRALIALTLGSLFAFAIAYNLANLYEPTDLAQGKPWRISSNWGDCEPEKGHCQFVQSRILFHTLEDDSPWFEIDLQEPKRFRSLTVINREDEFPERAVPLVAEVSDDAATWRQVARTEEVFETWKPKFPEQTARYVRMRADRKTWLHLIAVKVHP